MGRMTAAEQRARAVLDRLPDGPVVGAEVGVFDGRMSRHLLERPDLRLVMVDRWDAPTEAYTLTGDPRAELGRDEMSEAKRTAMLTTAFAATRRTVAHMDSLAAAANPMLADLDFVFLDADHGYEAVAADIEAWRHTLKPGGLLCGHDYGDERFGVTEAVDDACETHGWALETGADRTWFVVVP